MIVFFGNTLNRHQCYVSDALYEMTNGEYIYVETLPPTKANQAGGKKKVERAYVFEAFKSEVNYTEAVRLACEAEVALFGANSLVFEVERMKQKNPGLAFEVSERWLKKGWVNIFSLHLIQNLWYHYTQRWAQKPLYKLCASAYGAGDQYKLNTFKNRCYKWGYFTEVDENFEPERTHLDTSISKCIPIMWCARFISWKHPELPIRLAAKLKKAGYRFVIDMYGTGEKFERIKTLSVQQKVDDVVRFMGACSNMEILAAMREHEIFLLTSDRNEGWGAVLNEAMSNGCTVVASEAVGAVPFLVKDGVNGSIFISEDIDSFYDKTVYLLENAQERMKLSCEAYHTMRESWSPEKAASNLLQLIDNLTGEHYVDIKEGPCSIAEPLTRQ